MIGSRKYGLNKSLQMYNAVFDLATRSDADGTSCELCGLHTTARRNELCRHVITSYTLLYNETLADCSGKFIKNAAAWPALDDFKNVKAVSKLIASEGRF